jgi:hypothetical protein
MKLSHRRQETADRDSGGWTPNGGWLQRFVRRLDEEMYGLWPGFIIIAMLLIAVIVLKIVQSK